MYTDYKITGFCSTLSGYQGPFPILPTIVVAKRNFDGHRADQTGKTADSGDVHNSIVAGNLNKNGREGRRKTGIMSKGALMEPLREDLIEEKEVHVVSNQNEDISRSE